VVERQFQVVERHSDTGSGTPFRLNLTTECIVAKRCVIEQKLLLTAYRKSHMWNRLVPKNEWPWPLFRDRIKVMSTIALHSTLTISETVRDRGFVPKDHQQKWPT